MERLTERLAIARRALGTLEELSREPFSKIVRDAAIQRFEYTFEAVWKAAQRYLDLMEGFEVGSPKTVFRTCLDAGLLDAAATRQALSMTDDRNLTAHTYNEELAVQIYSRIPNHLALMRDLVTAMESRLAAAWEKP